MTPTTLKRDYCGSASAVAFASTSTSPSKGTPYQTKNTSNTLTSLYCDKYGQDCDSSIDSEYSQHFHEKGVESSDGWASTTADEIAMGNFNYNRSNDKSKRGRGLASSTFRSITRRVARGRSLNVRSLNMGRRNHNEDDEYLLHHLNQFNQVGGNGLVNSSRNQKEITESSAACKSTLSDTRDNIPTSSAIGFNASFVLTSTPPAKNSKARLSHKRSFPEPRPSNISSRVVPDSILKSNQGEGKFFSSNQQKASFYRTASRRRPEGRASGRFYTKKHGDNVGEIAQSKNNCNNAAAPSVQTLTPRGTQIDESRRNVRSQVAERREGNFRSINEADTNLLICRNESSQSRGKEIYGGAFGKVNAKTGNESCGRSANAGVNSVSQRNLKTQALGGHAPSRGKSQREKSRSIVRDDSSKQREQSTRGFEIPENTKNSPQSIHEQGSQKAPGQDNPFSTRILHSKETTSKKEEIFPNNARSSNVGDYEHDGLPPRAIINYNYYIQNQINHYRSKRDMTPYHGREHPSKLNASMPKQVDHLPTPTNRDYRQLHSMHRAANTVEEVIKSSSSSSGNTSESSPTKNKQCAICRQILHSGEYVEYCNIYFCKKSNDGVRGTCFKCAFCHRSMDELLLNRGASNDSNAILNWTKVTSNSRGSIIKCGQCAMGLAFPSTLTSAPSAAIEASIKDLSPGDKGDFTSELIVRRIREVNETYHRGRHGFRSHRVHYFRSQSAPHALPTPPYDDQSDDDSSDSNEGEVLNIQKETQVHSNEYQRQRQSISNAAPNNITSTTNGSDLTTVASKIKNRSELIHEMHSLRSQNKRLEEMNSNLELKNKQLSTTFNQLSTVVSTSKQTESELIQQVAAFVSQTKSLAFEYHRMMEIFTQKEMELSFLRHNAQIDRSMGGRDSASYDASHSNQSGQSNVRDEFRLHNIPKYCAENIVSFTDKGASNSVVDEKGYTIPLNDCIVPHVELDQTDSIEHRNALARSA